MKKYFLNINVLVEKFSLKSFINQYSLFFLTFIIAAISFPGVSPEYDGSYDGKMASAIVKKLLSEVQ